MITILLTVSLGLVGLVVGAYIVCYSTIPFVYSSKDEPTFSGGLLALFGSVGGALTVIAGCISIAYGVFNLLDYFL